MNISVNTKTLKRMDPIWRRLRIDRFWALLFVIYTLFFLIYSIWARYFGANRDASLIWLYIFNLIIWGNNAVKHFKKESYWKRVGQRRLEALHDAQPFLAAKQPSKDESGNALPFMLHLHWQRSITLTIGGLLLVLVLLFFTFGSLTLSQHDRGLDILIGAVVFLLTLLVVCIIVYLFYLRNLPSFVEINDTGIKTRYMQQERFLRWDEVRIFASYRAQGTKKDAVVFTYEVSNEHTVVRWSQSMLTNPFFLLRSNSDRKENWNQVISRINSIAALYTDLPLLDLSD